MVRKTNKQWLYLVKIEPRTVAIIPAKDSSEAIDKYIARTGVANIHTYASNYLMAHTIEITTSANIGISDQCYFITKTISGSVISIISLRVVSCDDIFKMIDPKNINSPLFIRPSTDEVRNCVGFSRTPEYKLRKFCICEGVES